jgi:hypothetical protein
MNYRSIKRLVYYYSPSTLAATSSLATERLDSTLTCD